MSAAARLGGFGALLALVFVAALGLGSVVGPVGPTSAAAAEDHGSEDEHAEDLSADDRPVGVTGLAVSEGGYTLESTSTLLRVGPQTFSFVVRGPDGEPLRAYEPTHERDLHLIVVRRDLTRFQHLHPSRAADGTWQVALSLDAAGPYRVFADFAPSGAEARTLGIDVTVPGAYSPEPGPGDATTSTVDEAYAVTRSGELRAGEDAELTFTVVRGGTPVTDLQPYLGAYGHLVVLRGGDLAYLHVHPVGGTGAGPNIRFGTTVPSEGGYRAFLDFQHAGAVRTATWALTTGDGHGN